MKLSDVEVMISQQRDINRRLNEMVFEAAHDQGDNEYAILKAYAQSQRTVEALIALSKKLK